MRGLRFAAVLALLLFAGCFLVAMMASNFCFLFLLIKPQLQGLYKFSLQLLTSHINNVLSILNFNFYVFISKNYSIAFFLIALLTQFLFFFNNSHFFTF